MISGTPLSIKGPLPLSVVFCIATRCKGCAFMSTPLVRTTYKNNMIINYKKIQRNDIINLNYSNMGEDLPLLFSLDIRNYYIFMKHHI